MAKRVKVNLFGKNGQRSLHIRPRGGFSTRHIKVVLEDAVPSIFSPVTPERVAAERKAKRKATVPAAEKEAAALLKPPVPKNDDPKRPITPAAVLEVLQKMTQAANPRAVDHDWFIIDEILYVATAKCRLRANHTTLLAALRELYRHGRVEHKTNRFDQHMFKWVEAEQKTDLHTLLAEVDAIMGGTSDA